MNFGSHYECECASGYAGIGCLDVDECDANNVTLCNNRGTCANNPGSFVCICDSGYAGLACELDATTSVITFNTNDHRSISRSDVTTTTTTNPSSSTASDNTVDATVTPSDGNAAATSSGDAITDVMTPGARSDEVSGDDAGFTNVIVGGIVGAVVLLLLLSGIAIACIRGKRNRRARDAEYEADYERQDAEYSKDASAPPAAPDAVYGDGDEAPYSSSDNYY